MHDPSEPLPLLTVVGERVALGPLNPELAHLYARWRNDLFVQRTFGSMPRAVTAETMRALIEKRMDSEDAFWFTIYVREQPDAAWRAVGTTDLFNIDFRFRSAMFGMAIGEADARGRGYGTEAVRLILDLAFTALGLRNVTLVVAEYNLAGRRAYEKAGFKMIGRRRQADELMGVIYDELYMDCVASEFQSTLLTEVLAPDVPRVAANPDDETVTPAQPTA